ncbi:MAG: TRAP transporter substrate-binding protein [Dethiobacteria bacterium]|jgi:TRAP-type C4-dicarboxylate transport system substrate-binding protein
MKKRKLLKTIVNSSIILLLVLSMGACTPATPEKTQAGDLPAGAETFTLKFSTWHPPAGEECQNVWTPMLEELKNRSEGRLTYTPYYGAALGGAAEHYDIVRDGLADMGYFTATWTPDRFPISDVLSMPAQVLGKDVAVEIGNEMYERMLHTEFADDVKVLSLNGCVSSFIWTRKPVRSLEDLKGLRIRTPGGLQTYMIEALGAEPAFMPLGDVYLAMETGNIDGIVTCPMLYKAYKLHELGKHAVVATFGCVTEGVIINKDTWNKLPADLQTIVEEVTKNPFQLTGGLTEEVIQRCNAELSAAGVEFYELPAEEAARWYDRFSEKVVQEWVNNMEKRGLPGKEALLNYKAVLDKHGVEFPSFPPAWAAEVEQYR